MGCTDYKACNYDINAEIDSGNCVYAEDNYNCEGDCIAKIDCSGICGGKDTENIDCAGSCLNENVLLWDVCYNIENTVRLKLSKDMVNGKSIPKDIGKLINLKELRFYKTNLVGEIPKEIGDLVNLESLTLSFNKLNGEIPKEIGKLTNLKRLYLNNNQLSGKIPKSFEKLKKLNTLLLSNNRLEGDIPSFICNLELSFFNNNKDYFRNNSFCPPYPKCISKNIIGYQSKRYCN